MSEEKRKIRVGITHGDFNGIGYETIIKALGSHEITELFTPIIFGSTEVAARTVSRLRQGDFWFATIEKASDALDNQINLVDVCGQGLHQTLGIPSREAGRAAEAALDAAVDALKSGEIDVLVTAPIDKNSIQSETFQYSGHTEYLEDRFKTEDGKALMIMADDFLRVALVTTHVPLAKVPEMITKERVAETIRNFNKALKMDFACDRPRIAVLSLNPHCGDGGLLGREEIDEIIPAIEECKNEGILAMGPLAADGLFGSGGYINYDGVLAMYHDQGLAPFKAIAREKGINFTAGLEIVRTSPDHGTAYDKAGHGTADETSMREAIYKAIDIARRRKVYKEAAANPLPVSESKFKDNRRGRQNRPEPDVKQEDLPQKEEE